MAQDVTIAGAAYAAVPGVALPLTAGGGSALFVDTADATASAADIASGMTAYVNGEKVTGTASGWTTLWANSSPTDAFAAQTVSISGLSEYDRIAIEYRPYASVSRADTTISEYATSRSVVIAGARATALYTRIATLAQNSITFAAAVSSSGSTGNNYCVPVAVHGISS